MTIQVKWHIVGLFVNASVTTSSSHLTALSSASWRSINHWSANFVWGHDCMMWIIVCHSPHWHLSEEVGHHFCRLAAHNPVFIWKWFSNDHVWRGNSKPGCRTVGLDTSALLATIAKCQTSCHLVFISEVVKSNHSGFLEWSGVVGGQTHRCGLANSRQSVTYSEAWCFSLNYHGQILHGLAQWWVTELHRLILLQFTQPFAFLTTVNEQVLQ